MVALNLDAYLRFLPIVKDTPENNIWLSFDIEADVLYINFKRPSIATDSDLTDDDVIVRYDGEEVVGLTVLHVSKRESPTA